MFVKPFSCKKVELDLPGQPEVETSRGASRLAKKVEPKMPKGLDE